MKIVLIDANHAFHRSFNKFGRFTFKGSGTGGIFGTLMLLSSAIRVHRPDQLEVIWDGGRSEHRLKIHPEYKAGRAHRTPEEKAEFEKQKHYTRMMITSLGIKQLIHPEMEADDLIAHRARYFNQIGNQITIVSSDKDFHQCINARTSVWDDIKKESLTLYNLSSIKGYKPHQSVDYLTLTGDKGDNIPGYPGIGEVRAKHFLEEFGSIEDFLLEKKFKHNLIDKKKLADHYSDTRMLIDLRLFYNVYLKNSVGIRSLGSAIPRYNEHLFLAYCEQCGFTTLNKKQNLDLFRK